MKVFVIFRNYKFQQLQKLFDFELSYLRIANTHRKFKNYMAKEKEKRKLAKTIFINQLGHF